MGSTLYTLAYIVGLVTSTLAADDGVHYEVVYSHPDPIQAVKGQVLTSIDIVEEMHIEMDIEVHSVYGSYPNIFTCADTNDLKMPSISLHGSGYFAIRWGTADKSDWNANVPGRGQIVAGETYHLELDMAPDSWTVTLDGVVVYDESGLGEPLTFENVPCYVSNPWFGEADVTVSNLFIGIPSEYQEVYSHPEAFLEPEQNVAITTIDIVEEMHFEMDIAVHSLSSHYKPVFRCTDGGDYTKMPYVVTHQDGQIMTRWSTADSAWSYDSPKKGIVAGSTHHLEMDMAPGSWTVTLDGVVVYDKSELGEPLSIENVPCYVYGGSIGSTIGADVTVSNLFIGVPPTSAADPDPTEPSPEEPSPEPVFQKYEVTVEACDGDSFIGDAAECEAAANALGITWNSCCQNNDNLPYGCLKRSDNDVIFNGKADTSNQFPCDVPGNCDHGMRWAVCSKTEAHYVAQGRTSWGGWDSSDPDYYCQDDASNQALYSSSKHGTNIGVGCCSEDGTKGYRPNCNAHPATYEDAVAVCSASGYRLCTLDEMMSGITGGKGCWYDAAYQWVSDSCSVSVNAAAMHSGTAEEMEHGTNGNADYTNWTTMAVTIGALAVVAAVISVVLLMKKRNTSKSAAPTSVTTAHVVSEMSISEVPSTTTTDAADSMTVNVDPEASPTQISETINGAENV